MILANRRGYQAVGDLAKVQLPFAEVLQIQLVYAPRAIAGGGIGENLRVARQRRRLTRHAVGSVAQGVALFAALAVRYQHARLIPADLLHDKRGGVLFARGGSGQLRQSETGLRAKRTDRGQLVYPGLPQRVQRGAHFLFGAAAHIDQGKRQLLLQRIGFEYFRERGKFVARVRHDQHEVRLFRRGQPGMYARRQGRSSVANVPFR